MKIHRHSESHIVTLSDDSIWRIYPGDLDLTLEWLPDTELELIETKGQVASHVLVDAASGACVRVRPQDEAWPEREIKDALKGG